MNVLVINSSPQQDESSAYSVVQTIITRLLELNTTEVEHIDATALPHIDKAYARALCSVDNEHDSSYGSLALSDRLISSLEVADVVIIASPIHNYSLPSGLKSWVDHVVRAGRTFEITATGKRALLDDKPVYILISSGGVFSGKDANQPDFFTPYMKEVMATIGLNNIQFFSIEATVGDKISVQQRIEDVQHQVREHLMATTV